MPDRREGDGPFPTLERLCTIVEQRTDTAVWRKFLVAQATYVESPQRRRSMTTQRIFLLNQPT